METFENRQIPNFEPDISPIETRYDLKNIPGTILDIGKIEKVYQISGQELVTTVKPIGIKCGCSHFIFQVDDDGEKPGIGGQCFACLSEANLLLSQGIVDQHQADSMSLYCSKCASFCQGCKRNVCLRHTQPFRLQNGELMLLCPVCYQKATETLADKIYRFLSDLFGPKENLLSPKDEDF